MTAITDLTTIPRSLLRTWAQIMREQTTPSEVIPWWLDHATLMQSIASAAETLGWRVLTQLNSDNPSEQWDMYIEASDTRAAIRCVYANIIFESGTIRRNVIAEAWRYLSLMAQPLRGTIGIHLVAALPLITNTDDEATVRHMVSRWLAAGRWNGENGMSVWVDTVEPIPRNSVGTAFPGLGLKARVAAHRSLIR